MVLRLFISLSLSMGMVMACQSKRPPVSYSDVTAEKFTPARQNTDLKNQMVDFAQTLFGNAFEGEVTFALIDQARIINQEFYELQNGFFEAEAIIEEPSGVLVYLDQNDPDPFAEMRGDFFHVVILSHDDPHLNHEEYFFERQQSGGVAMYAVGVSPVTPSGQFVNFSYSGLRPTEHYQRAGSRLIPMILIKKDFLKNPGNFNPTWYNTSP